MTLDRVLSLGIFFALALALSGCPGEDDNPQSACDQIDCGTNSHCDEALEECVCDAGFTFFDGACVDSRTVSCIDVAPENATSVVEDIEIAWTSEGWGPVADCGWSCDANYDLFDGACINRRQVECAGEAPENGSSRIETVQITFTDAAGWSAVPECDWDCDEGYVPWGDECVNTRMVPCEATEIPANASAVVVDVEITYSVGIGWTAPAKCDWSCEVGYGEHQGACLASRTVACVNVAPANATSEFRYSTIYWDDYAQAWPAAPDCAWSCHAGLGEYEGECLASVEVTCIDNPPANAETTNDSLLVTIVWNNSAWSSPATCPWICLTDFDRVQGQCINSSTVTCDGSSRPANSYAHFEDEVITYTDAGGWTLRSECDWSCNPTYGEHPDFQGQCLQSVEVLCVSQGVVAPTNGTVDDTALVTVSWDDAEGWSDPAECDWECDATYSEHPELLGQCLQIADVLCDSEGVTAPENGTLFDDVLVPVTWEDTTGWTDAAPCDWSCNATYGEHPDFQGQCLQSAEVLCNPQGVLAPTNGSVDDTALVTVSWDDAAGWSNPALCPWSCDESFAEHSSLPGECHDVLTVECSDESPANAVATATQVVISWDEGAKAWSSDVCPWECIAGYHLEDEVCVPNRSIGWCSMQYPWDIRLGVDVVEDFYGQVWVDGLTGGPTQLTGISAKWCYGVAPIAMPIALDAMNCLPAEYFVQAGNNDEYLVSESFDQLGEYEYVYAFSGDGGDTWTSCLVTDPASGMVGEPGFAQVLAPEIIVDEPLRDLTLPMGWNETNIGWETGDGGYARFLGLDSVLQTPVLDLSGHSTVTLEFSVAKYGTGDDGPITVEISDDGGVTWSAHVFDSPIPTDATYVRSGPTPITATGDQVVIRFTREKSPSEKRFRDVIILGVPN